MDDKKLKIILHKKRETIQQEWSVLEIAKKHPPYGGWSKIFEEHYPEFEDLDKTLKEDEINYGSFFPLKKDLFNAFEITPLHSVEVVILGQDPYPQPRSDGYPRAQGLSFSVDKCDSIPSSLKNIFKELKRSYPNYIEPSNGDLSSWAKQGVLLLNSCLTVRPNVPTSHGVIWDFLIISVFKELARVNPNCIYVFWGKVAQNYSKFLSGNPTILTSVHPSGRNFNNPKIKEPFYGCNHFVKINEILKSKGKKEIDWTLE